MNLTQQQFTKLVDILIEEMFLIYQFTIEKNDSKNEFLSYLDNRVELFDKILKNQTIDWKNLFKLFLNRLHVQKKILSSQNKHIIDFLKEFLSSNGSIIDLSDSEIMEYSKNILYRVQTYFLYRLYLNHNTLIYELINSNRLFCTTYHLFDKPTKVI